MLFKNLFKKEIKKETPSVPQIPIKSCKVYALYQAILDVVPGEAEEYTFMLDKKEKDRIVFRAYSRNKEDIVQIHLRKWGKGTRKDLPKVMVLDVVVGEEIYKELPILNIDSHLKSLVLTFSNQLIQLHEEKKKEEQRKKKDDEAVRLKVIERRENEEKKRQEQALSEWRELLKNLA